MLQGTFSVPGMHINGENGVETGTYQVLIYRSGVHRGEAHTQGVHVLYALEVDPVL